MSKATAKSESARNFAYRQQKKSTDRFTKLTPKQRKRGEKKANQAGKKNMKWHEWI